MDMVRLRIWYNSSELVNGWFGHIERMVDERAVGWPMGESRGGTVSTMDE